MNKKLVVINNYYQEFEIITTSSGSKQATFVIGTTRRAISGWHSTDESCITSAFYKLRHQIFQECELIEHIQLITNKVDWI